jgi:hypothetical protein
LDIRTKRNNFDLDNATPESQIEFEKEKQRLANEMKLREEKMKLEEEQRRFIQKQSFLICETISTL